MTFYLSEILGKPVLNKSGESIGYVADLVVTEIDKNEPRIHGIVFRRVGRNQQAYIPEHDIKAVTETGIKLTSDLVNLAPFDRRDNEILLAKDVYDKQIVDIDDRRLTRVNDLLLITENGRLVLKGVDVSSVGVLARLNIPTLGILKRNVVDWEDVQFLGSNLPVKFKVQYKNLESLHPVDIARIIFEGPGYKQGSRVLAQLQDPIAADIIEELSPKLQRNLIETMKVQDVADVITHMPSNKAADLLVVLGPDYAQKIYPLLPNEQTLEIQQLLKYPETATGAYMRTDYVAVPQNINLTEVLERIRRESELPDFLLYMYALENEFSNRLSGVLSVYELFTADLRNRVEAVMVKDVITSTPDESIKEALKKMYRYNISAIPVVSKNERRLLGIVTFRDAISIYLPKRWKVRIHHIFS